MAPAASSMNNPADQHVEWLIVVKEKGEHVVYNVELHSRMSGSTAMRAIVKAYWGSNPSVPWYHSQPCVEVAIISSFTVNANLEAQDYPRHVIIKASEPNLELTEDFRNPSSLDGTDKKLLLGNPQFNVADGQNTMNGNLHAIMIKTNASRWMMAAGMTGAIFVSAVIGCIVGFLSGNAELGVASGVGVVEVFTFLQAVIVFFK